MRLRSVEPRDFRPTHATEPRATPDGRMSMLRSGGRTCSLVKCLRRLGLVEIVGRVEPQIHEQGTAEPKKA